MSCMINFIPAATSYQRLEASFETVGDQADEVTISIGISMAALTFSAAMLSIYLDCCCCKVLS